jgi:DNA-binding SARP family transcriptional activator
LGGLTFRVLGPVEALRDGNPVALGGRLSVNLLAGLLLSANQPVSYDRLADIVWGDNLPVHPQAALQNLKSRLHHALGREAIQMAGPGYQLAAEDDALDLLSFDRLIDIANSAAESPRRAVLAIDQALSLWSLPVLANVSSCALQREGAAFLTERYLNAQVQRADLQLKLGWYPSMIPELGRLVSAYPFREDLVGPLMLALYRSHRQADALLVYHGLQKELRENLGIDPSASLQALHVEILRHGASLDPAECDART